MVIFALLNSCNSPSPLCHVLIPGCKFEWRMAAQELQICAHSAFWPQGSFPACPSASALECSCALGFEPGPSSAPAGAPGASAAQAPPELTHPALPTPHWPLFLGDMADFCFSHVCISTTSKRIVDTCSPPSPHPYGPAVGPSQPLPALLYCPYASLFPPIPLRANSESLLSQRSAEAPPQLPGF